MRALGDFVGGRFLAPEGAPLVSMNPAREGEVVFETAWSAGRAAAACEAAAEAAPAWAALSLDARWAALVRFREAIAADAAGLAEAITLEMGKLRSESKVEVAALIGRFDLVLKQIKGELLGGPVPGFPDEVLTYRPHGVVGVIGPFNFPLHLCHAHVVPALLTGNAVVVKPSDLTPLCGQRYAEAAMKAGLPAGVLNVVLGGGAAGAALTASPRVRGLCFTGSWEVGHRILKDAIDRPELLVALEMGGKNTTIVLDDADIRHAAHDIVVGGYLTTGQRCTCTDRVLVQRSQLGPLLDALRPMVAGLSFGDPDDDRHFGGPLASRAALERFERVVEAGRRGGAEAIVPGGRIEGGAFARASLHLLPQGSHDAPGYTDAEIFGPDVGVEVVEDEQEAIAVLAASPFGLANSVFTARQERFDAVLAGVSCGLLNWNRTTNQASARLPFGGAGRSGNFRPAGSWAARNTVMPVATRTALPGDFDPDPKLRDALIPPNLDRLAAQHAAEEAEELARELVTSPRPMAICRPPGGRLPISDHWLARLYARGRMAKEKKPGVFDHLRSVGPWMVSVDDAPLSTLDSMSQTATVCAGFAEDEVVRAYTEGEFGHTSLRAGDTELGDDPAALDFARLLRGILPELPCVSFTGSGAEANEKAFALCRLASTRPGADRVLAFEGSFHGRTMMALHSTWNPSKRAPFEIPGHESTFAPFPLWENPMEPEPEAPEGFLAAAARGDLDALRAIGAQGDALLAAEVASLGCVHEALLTGRIFACTIEPMQSEGGDRYATARFFKALRLLTRHHAVSLIFDEVQCGFGLGGPFFWHTAFGLVDAEGAPDHPDAVVVAKRAQVGVCMSRFEDPEPSSAHPASLVRGRLHAQMMLGSSDWERVERAVWPRLQEVARRFPELVLSPRIRGFAFAFDLPTEALLAPFFNQRFWRGAVVFGAGDRTVRYRLSSAFGEAEIEMVFDAMRRSLAWLEAHPGKNPPVWEDLEPAPRAAGPSDIVYRVGAPAEADAVVPRIMALEARIFEPARRDPEATLRLGFEDPHGVAILAERGGELVGYAVGAPLERIEGKDGIRNAPMYDRHNTLHSIAISVDPSVQGAGVGMRLKIEQILRTRAMVGANGQPRYRYITGRNRVGYTDAMTRLNRRLGAYTVKVLTQQYGDPKGEAVYYRLPVRGGGPDPTMRPEPEGLSADLAGGIADPLSAPPASLVALEQGGGLRGATVTKITICNYITPAVVRATEWACALLPDHPHVYLTSGRDEAADKAIRTLRYHRKAANVALAFEGGYFGHTSSGARSLSDPSVHAQGPRFFEWPLLPHPADVGVEAAIAAIEAAAQAAGGPGRVLGLFTEVVQERTGRVIPAAFWPALRALRGATGLPLALFETATASWRSGLGAFASSGLPIDPDILAWWGGGQTGFVHLKPEVFIDKPLMMVSTWDGDELSMIRLHHQLRAARLLDLKPGLAAMARVDEAAADAGLTIRGMGLYRVIEASPTAAALKAAADARGLQLRAFSNGNLALIPHLDTAAADLDILIDLLGALRRPS